MQAAIQRLEQIVHPLVQQERQRFLQTASHESVRLVVFDIPLLYETGAESQVCSAYVQACMYIPCSCQRIAAAQVDAVAVVSCSSETQRQRVLLRAGMEPGTFMLRTVYTSRLSGPMHRLSPNELLAPVKLRRWS